MRAKQSLCYNKQGVATPAFCGLAMTKEEIATAASQPRNDVNSRHCVASYTVIASRSKAKAKQSLIVLPPSHCKDRSDEAISKYAFPLCHRPEGHNFSGPSALRKPLFPILLRILTFQESPCESPLQDLPECSL